MIEGPATPEPGGRGAFRLPGRRRGPLSGVVTRIAIASGLLLATTLLVYLGRHGYRDLARPGRPLELVDAFYYSTVTLSATGYGDIVPVTVTARLVNTFLVTPLRVAFLIVLIGTTLEVLAERTRTGWRISRWRSKLSAHTVIVGYGTKGRSALGALRAAGVDVTSVLIVDVSPEVIAAANEAGLTGVIGDATSRAVLDNARIGAADRLVVAVGRDDSAVLITLTARQLSPRLTIAAAIRESENEPLLRQSGADFVVVSSATAGRILALSSIEPAASAVLAGLAGRDLGLFEWPAGPGEIGRPAHDARAGTMALMRRGRLLALDDPRCGQIEAGDHLVRVSALPSASPDHSGTTRPGS